MTPQHYHWQVGGDDTPIAAPLSQPAKVLEYYEGGSWDYLVKRGNMTILVKPSARYIPGALKGIQADVLFLGIASVGKQDAEFRDAFFDETVGTVRPKLVIAVHWNDFFAPVTDNMPFLPKIADDTPAGLNYMIGRCKQLGVKFGLMQGFTSVLLS